MPLSPPTYNAVIASTLITAQYANLFIYPIALHIYEYNPDLSILICLSVSKLNKLWTLSAYVFFT